MRKSVNSILLFLSIAILIAPCGAAAQDKSGAITGRVADAQNAVLPGARVEMLPRGQVVASDGKGQFTILNLTPGHYTLRISYVGFAPFSTEVDVAAGQTAKVSAQLQVGRQSEVVEVRAERQHGEVEAINRQRMADNILQVLPSEVITSLPNANIADAVGRLPSVSLERDEGEGKYVQIRGTEPRLSNVTIDGVHLASPEKVRNVKLDAIPADLVEAVEISKTLSANQEGDAIGGSVNLVTKSASDQPYLSLLGMGGYTPIEGGRGNNQFSGTFGKRFGANKKLGFLFGGSYDWNARGIDDIEPSPDTNDFGTTTPNIQPVVTAADLRQYWYDRTRYGFGGTLDYKLGPMSSAYVRGMFSRFQDFGDDWIYSITTGSFLTPTTTDNTGNMQLSHVVRRPEQRLFNTVMGARQEFGPTLVNYDLSFGQARQTGGFFSAVFNGPQAVTFNLDTSDPFTPKFPVQGGTNIFDPTTYTIDNISTSPDNHTFERDISGNFSVNRQYAAGSHYGSFEAGVKVRDAHKSEFDQQRFFNFTGASPLQLSSALNGFTNSNYYFGDYQVGPISDYNKISSFFNSNLSSFTEDVTKGHTRAEPNDFGTDERVYAGYGMNTINLGHFRLQTGMRVEHTEGSFVGNRVNFDATGKFVSVTPVPGSQSYTDVLPSVQLQYTFGQNTTLRAAYGRGIARPNFSDLPPSFVEDDRRKRVTVGNPALLPTHAHNFDLLIEHYLKPVGVIQAGVFYKALSDPIFNVTSNLAIGAGTFIQTQPINGPSAHITGVEMTWQQHLTFLPGPLSGTGVRANYSYTTSQASFPVGFGRTDRPALQRQAPNNWNFDVTYDRKGFSARMGLTHNDANIFSYQFKDGADLGITGPHGDQYLYPRTQVDAQASYWIPRGHGLQAIVSMLNLNNEVFGFYQGSEQFPIQREYYGRTFSAGLRWSSTREPR
jgi:TonB-dependent receptor